MINSKFELLKTLNWRRVAEEDTNLTDYLLRQIFGTIN